MKKKLSKARIVARHSSPDKWHLKSNDFFHFCGQEYIWFIFHFNNAQNQAARKWRVKKWPPFSESGLGTWYILWSPADSLSLTRLLSIAGLVWVQPPIDLHLIFEKLSLRNQVERTAFLVYFELDFYCLCSRVTLILEILDYQKAYQTT